MVVAITMACSRKPPASQRRRRRLWDKIAAEIAAAPDGCYIDPGNELTQKT
jgi:hypothetical protein